MSGAIVERGPSARIVSRLISRAKAVHKARLLQLPIDKAHYPLGWSPVWRFSAAVAETMRWCRRSAAQRKMTATQVYRFTAVSRTASVTWTQS